MLILSTQPVRMEVQSTESMSFLLRPSVLLETLFVQVIFSGISLNSPFTCVARARRGGRASVPRISQWARDLPTKSQPSWVEGAPETRGAGDAPAPCHSA